MTINILLCDTFPGLLPEDIPSYVSMFTNLFDSVKQNITYRVFNSYKNEFPLNLKTNELYLITGSSSGAYEDKEWIKELIGFIRQAYLLKLPLVGICFGHQVIAQALGGSVEISEKGWGTGVRKSRLIDTKAPKYFLSDHMLLHYNHHDQVIQLPPDAIRFATSDFCLNEGFYINNHILTFQGHPEYTDSYNRYLLLNHSQGEELEVVNNALNSFRANKAMGQQAALWMLDLVNR